MTRLDKLLDMLKKSPSDPFLLYGAALEYKKSGQADVALNLLTLVVQNDENYCYAYYQAGQIREQLGDAQTAACDYRAGIEAAKRVGDAKALGELQGALDLL